MNSLYIGVFGLCGIFLRYWIDQLALSWSVPFPTGTFLINLSGSFLAGLIYALSIERGIIPNDLKIGLLVGFCGGFTTFSAYTLQSFLLLDQRRILLSIVYLCSSPILGLVCTFLGVALVRTWISR